jgi:uncharacterized protein (DUF927 family)
MVKSGTENGKEMDKRIIEKKLKKGEMTEKELKAYLKKLPDLSDYVEDAKVEKKKGKAS